jgi:hypothetical protein
MLKLTKKRLSCLENSMGAPLYEGGTKDLKNFENRWILYLMMMVIINNFG